MIVVLKLNSYNINRVLFLISVTTILDKDTIILDKGTINNWHLLNFAVQ